MADKRGVLATSCNDKCGCPYPCPGGDSCRCSTTETTSGGGHMRCECGEHCTCNPCTCSKSTEVEVGVGKAYCKCGDGCACVPCRA